MAPNRWTEEEKRQFVATRAQNLDMSWEEFQKKFWPTRTVGALTFMHSELKRTDRLKAQAKAREQNTPQQLSTGQPLLNKPPPDQGLSNTAKRAREPLREGDANCETENSPAQSSQAAKRSRREDLDGRTEQQINVSPIRGNSSPANPQMQKPFAARRSVSTSSTSSTSSAGMIIDHVVKPQLGQLGHQSEPIEAARGEEEPAHGLPLPSSIKEAVLKDTMHSGPIPAQQSEQPNNEGGSPIVSNGIENEIADLGQPSRGDVSVVRKRPAIVQVQGSDFSETLSNLQSMLFEAHDMVRHFEQQMEKQVKEAVEKAISQKDDEKERLIRALDNQNKHTVELLQRNRVLEEEIRCLKERIQRIMALAKII